MRSLRALLESDHAGAGLAVSEHEASGRTDPESLFYVTRHMARLDEPGRAIEILFRVIDQNFFCDFSLAHDPWLSLAQGIQRANWPRSGGHSDGSPSSPVDLTTTSLY
jgi:hypothetical protein